MRQARESTKDFYTTHEAAKLLEVTPRTVQLWCEKGVLACRRTIGGHRRILRASIENMLPAAVLPRSIELPLQAQVAPEHLRILVVEDDSALSRLYRIQLARWDFRPIVTTVENGFEALVRLGSNRPDLLIADLHMPEWDGFQMLRKIRGMADLDPMEIVVVTGLSAAEVSRRGGLPDDIRILPKPIPFQELERMARVLAMALGRAGASNTALQNSQQIDPTAVALTS